MKSYLIEKQTDVNEITNKWGLSGLLDSTKEENKKKTAMGFEIIKMNYMYNNLAGDYYVKVLILPVVCRILRDTPREYNFLELTTEVMNIFNQFSDFSKTFDFEEFKKEKVEQEHLDREACIVSDFCVNYQYLFS